MGIFDSLPHDFMVPNPVRQTKRAAPDAAESGPTPSAEFTTSPRRPGGAEPVSDSYKLGAEAMREAAAKVADGMKPYHFHFETAAAIRSLPLPAGDTLSTGGWNSDMEKAPKDTSYGKTVDLWLVQGDRGWRETDCHECYSEKGTWLNREGRWVTGGRYYEDGKDYFSPHPIREDHVRAIAWRLPPEPPPGE